MSNVYMGTDVEEFIFGEATYEEGCKKETAEEEDKELMESIQAEMDATGVRECVDEPEVACYRIALENEQNYNAIMNAFMMKEFSVLESTGQEMVYEAADVKKFFENVKNMVLKFWEKIKGVFKALAAKIAGAVTTNKAFIKKYKDGKFETPKAPFPGYEFPNVKDETIYTAITNMIPGSDASLSNMDQVNKLLEMSLDDIKGEMRGAAIADPNKKIEAGSFSTELKKYFYGSEKKKENVKLPAFSALISELEGAKEARKKMKDAYKGAEKAVKEDLKKLQDAKKAVEKNDENRGAKMKAAKFITDCISASIHIMSATNSMHVRALYAKVMQDRAMAAFYVANQPKEEKKVDESAIDDLGIVLI